MSTIDTSGSPATSSQDAPFTFSASPGFTTECSLDGAAFRRCSSPRTYHGLAAGLHTFCIRAVQGALQESVPDCRTWRIVGPGAPDAAIDAAPFPLTPSHDATFRFHADQPATRFECRLDASAFRSCSSELTYHGLALGPHTFSVRAVNFAGETDASPARPTHHRRRGAGPSGSPNDCAVAAPARPLSPGAATAGCCGCGAGRSPGRSDP